MLDEAILAIVALNLLFSVWMMRVLALQIQTTVGQLDRMLAEAISKLIDRGLGEIEPINPIQQAIASMIQNNLGKATQDPNIVDIPLTRDSSGKFS
tara:strand:+ start:273 stop:560 length:288 start_codon:yes stop_codon:yes gene_type:complete